ncbi:hypothetical protein NMG60_11033727 [Bertholletia excelsa]
MPKGVFLETQDQRIPQHVAESPILEAPSAPASMPSDPKLDLLITLRKAAIRPPTFVFFVNDAKLFPETYRRYMEKQLRSDAGFSGTPIRLLWRSREKCRKMMAGL